MFDSFGLILVSHGALHKLCQATTTFVSRDMAVDCIFVILLRFFIKICIHVNTLTVAILNSFTFFIYHEENHLAQF